MIIDISDDYEYDYGSDIEGRLGKTVYDPMEGFPSGPNGLVLMDEGGSAPKHRLCGTSPIPKIVCNGCQTGYPKYSRPCNQPDPTNVRKFKCRTNCGPGFQPAIRKMKCVGGLWKKLPAIGRIRCKPIKSQS